MLALHKHLSWLPDGSSLNVTELLLVTVILLTRVLLAGILLLLLALIHRAPGVLLLLLLLGGERLPILHLLLRWASRVEVLRGIPSIAILPLLGRYQGLLGRIHL